MIILLYYSLNYDYEDPYINIDNLDLSITMNPSVIPATTYTYANIHFLSY